MTRSAGPRRRPTFSHRLEYVCLRIATAVFGGLSPAVQRATARFLSWVWFYVLPLRKRVVLENLARAFPDRPFRWRRRTARRCFQHFVRMMGFEFPAMLRFDKADFRRWLPAIEGMEHCDAAGGDTRSWIFVSGHLGNWELGVARLAVVEGQRTTVLAKPLHNPLVERDVARVRRERGYDVVYTRDNMRPVVTAVRQGRALAFLADQDARRAGIMAPFFSVPASTATGPAYFAHRLNLPIVVGFCVRDKGTDAYRLRFYPPIVPNPEADRETEIERLTRAHVALLEQAIREAPEQYFWFHRRWKTQPREAKRKV
ncbi:lysophospholipid acyltransferase family protein [Candidatus Sumerlaeota bacterium]|nr:lysophospholipid acyltransferase family protein [Candidatus Sumerlaeota bacterium]